MLNLLKRLAWLVLLAIAFLTFAAVAEAQVVQGSPLAKSSGNVANASAAAVLPAGAGVQTWISGFECTASGSTAASVANVTVSDGTWTLTYTFVFPAGVTLQATPLQVIYPTPIPSSTENTAITVTLAAGGSGNTHAACTANGFQL
jgi:hypothetical protein